MQHNTNQMKTEKILKCEYDLVYQYCNIIFFIHAYRTRSNGCVMTRMDKIQGIASNSIHILCFDSILDVVVSNKHGVVIVGDHVTFTFLFDFFYCQEDSGSLASSFACMVVQH